MRCDRCISLRGMEVTEFAADYLGAVGRNVVSFRLACVNQKQ